jgi:aminoglycoside/choline kinase family phosphotransferase
MAMTGALDLTFSINDDREPLRLNFLKENGVEAYERHPLAADASTRRYERLTSGDKSIMFMDAPLQAESAPCPPNADETTRNQMGWNAQSRLAASRVEAFVAVGKHLESLGLSAPKVQAHDVENGFALLEDLGNAVYADVIRQGEDEITLYEEAARALAVLHKADIPQQLSVGATHWPILNFDRLALAINADLFVDWYPHYDTQATSDESIRTQWNAARDALIEQALSYPRALIMRDYHAENLLWLPARNGVSRVGLLDFQDAVAGWAEWDFAMLLQDARREVSEQASEAAIAAYLDKTDGDRETFDQRLAVLGTLNALRVAGVFSRLVKRDGKEKYNAFQPRQLLLLSKNLQHPAVSDMRNVINKIAPHIVELGS